MLKKYITIFHSYISRKVIFLSEYIGHIEYKCHYTVCNTLICTCILESTVKCYKSTNSFVFAFQMHQISYLKC